MRLEQDRDWAWELSAVDPVKRYGFGIEVIESRKIGRRGATARRKSLAVAEQSARWVGRWLGGRRARSRSDRGC